MAPGRRFLRRSDPKDLPESTPASGKLSVLEEAVRERPGGPAQPPVLAVTRYELVLTLATTLLIAAAVTAIGVTASYVARRPAPATLVAPLEMMEIPGGAEDGSVEETLRVDSPAEERPDASIVDAATDQLSTVEETLENIIESSDAASEQSQQQFQFDPLSAGQRGSATGTGRRALGLGKGKSGLPRDQRWFITFSDRVPLPEYARQLDHFGIELGAVFTDRIVFLSRMSGQPATRTVHSGQGETRLYMNWQGGNRRQADLDLFRAAGIDAESALILHFYPPKTEAALAQLEREHAKRPVDQIKRTFFVVKSVEKSYEFEVTRQSYFQ